MRGLESKEIRDTLERLNNDKHNGIHIKGIFPLADELVKSGYRQENVLVEEVLEFIRQEIQPSWMIEILISKVREKYFAEGYSRESEDLCQETKER